MKKVSVSLEDDHIATIDDREDRDDISSRSEALRSLLDELEALREEYDDLRVDYDELEKRCTRLEREKLLILEQREETTELVKYVKDERTAEQKWREASIGKRIKWRLFGMDSE